MFPYADDTPSFSPPIWVIVLIALNVFIFVTTYTSGHDHYVRTIFAYGTIPARFFADDDSSIKFETSIWSFLQRTEIHPEEWAAPVVTLFTSMFLHGGWFHLIGNMWFLWLFGDNVEDRLGKLLFPVFYIVGGLGAGLLHVLFLKDSTVPAIGASGAIAAVMGAYIYLFPQGTLATLVTFYFYWGVAHVPAPVYLGLWFVLQLAGGLVSGGGANIAFWAHIGGFVTGLLLAMLLSSLGLITWYPGDRGYTFSSPVSIRRRRIPGSSRYTPPRRRKRYVWRD